MVLPAGEDAEGAVELLGEHDAKQVVREGHLRKAQSHVGAALYALGQKTLKDSTR